MWRERYQYDDAGNRIEVANGWGALASTFDEANRITRTGMRSYTHDAAGNLLREACDGVVTEYEYNGAHRMIARRHNTQEIIGVHENDRPRRTSYGYDALGRRGWREAHPAEAEATRATYLYADTGFDILGETAENLSVRMLDTGLSKEEATAGGRMRPQRPGSHGERHWLVEHLFLGGKPVRSAELTRAPSIIGGVEHKRYLGGDILGSVRIGVDENGTVRTRRRYDAFGLDRAVQLAPEFAGSSLAFGYTGKPKDLLSGLLDYGYRDYRPEVARFTTIDPVKHGENWFAYVAGDPVNYVDAWGLEAQPGTGEPPASTVSDPSGALEDTTDEVLIDIPSQLEDVSDPGQTSILGAIQSNFGMQYSKEDGTMCDDFVEAVLSTAGVDTGVALAGDADFYTVDDHNAYVNETGSGRDSPNDGYNVVHITGHDESVSHTVIVHVANGSIVAIDNSSANEGNKHGGNVKFHEYPDGVESFEAAFKGYTGFTYVPVS
jgi:RHS repeat-associated protein